MRCPRSQQSLGLALKLIYFLRVSWTARRPNQSILKEISPEYSLQGLMLKLKLQYFGQLLWRTGSFEKTVMLGKIEGRRRRGQQRIGWLDGITNEMDMSLSKFQELVIYREVWRAAVHGFTKSWTWLSDWTELNCWCALRGPQKPFVPKQNYFFSVVNISWCCTNYGQNCIVN